MEDDNTKLSASDYASLAVEAGIGMIPTIGGALQTAYFGAQNEKRFKRIERFYKEISEDMDKISPLIERLDEDKNHDQVIGIFETINEEIEKARSAKKKNYFKSLYEKCLMDINKDNWNQEDFFAQTLVSLSTTEIQLLVAVYEQTDGPSQSVALKGAPDGVAAGALSRLADLGLVSRQLIGLSIGGTGTSKYNYSLTALGDAFARACVFRP
jgi:hypothetical protein